LVQSPKIEPISKGHRGQFTDIYLHSGLYRLLGLLQQSRGKARELTGMSLWEFRQLLTLRRISSHYEETDLDEDVATLREMG
jgi:hypothetical protein